jgi:hypothetical protein
MTSPGRGVEDSGQTAALLRLIQLEADVRRVETEREMVFHLANESRRVLGFRQAFVFRCRRKWRLAAVSSVSTFDAQAPLNRELLRLVTSLGRQQRNTATITLDLSKEGAVETLRDYAFPHALWVPMRTRSGVPFAGLLMLRETPWPETVLPLAQRVVGTYGHAWQALVGHKLDRRIALPRKAIVLLAAAAVIALGFVKAPLTVLAPVEVTARDRISVAATINGVVEEVMVAPNSVVKEDELLARYDDTELRNALEIADRETFVASAKLEKLQNASFSDRAAARELKIAEAELALARAERALARDRLSRVEVRAPRGGLAVFDDARELFGRPVSVGERLMEIIDPSDLEFTVRLPVDDSIVLQEKAKLRVFLDSKPLTPIPAELTRRSYRATTQEDGRFAYTLTARAAQADLSAARLGAQGTALLYGDRHRLFFIVFRRPLSWIRQTFGF